MNRKQPIKLLLSLVVCALASSFAMIASASPRAKVSSEFGAYTEDDLIYKTAAFAAAGEWSESALYFNRSDYWGNSDFGAGYNTYANSSANKNSTTAATNAAAGLTTNIKIFGNNIEIVDIYTSAYTRMRPVSQGASFAVYVKGAQVYSRSASGTASWSWGQNLFTWEYSKTFYAGSWPVTVTAGVTGDASLSYGAGLAPTYMRAGLTGRAGLYAQAKGEIGVWWLAGAAAWANLTLVEPRLAFNATQSWDLRPVSGGCAVTFWKGTNGTLTLNSLSGNVKVQAQYLGFTNTATVFSWPGFTTTYNLIPNNMTAKVVTDPFACPTAG